MNFGYRETIDKQKDLVSVQRKVVSKSLVGVLKVFLYLLVLLIITVGFLGLGLLHGIIKSAPSVDDISITPSASATTVYDSNNKKISTLVTSGSNRIKISLDQVPDHLKWAFIDTEDSRFYEHNGIDVQGIGRAAFIALTTMNPSEGASTLTQQVLKNNVFTNWTNESSFLASFKRKIQEQYLAVQLEKVTSKDKILETYLNTINLGSNTLGVEAASRRYFNKKAKKLTISESAVIASITQNPSYYDPILNPKHNAKRRKKILKNMKAAGHITKKEYKQALKDDVYSRIQKVNNKIEKNSNSINSYFVDEVINQVMADLQSIKGYSYTQAYNAVYSGGLKIYSTQDSDIQKICDEETSNDANYPYSIYYSINWAWTVQNPDGTVDNYDESDISTYHRKVLGESNYQLIFSSKESAKAEVDAYKKHLKQKYYKKGVKKKLGYIQAETLYYNPQPQVSFTVMDQNTGYVKAIVGGRGKKNVNLSLNRATDSTRQPGSTFKVLAAYAPAIDTMGYTLSTTIVDEPYRYSNGRSVNNWYSGYRGTVTVKKAIADSMNVCAVKTITAITPQLGYDYLCNFGITTLVDNRVEKDGSVTSDIHQPLALGGITDGVTNLEMTAAYATIANLGTYTQPAFYSQVIDENGRVLLDRTTPTTHTVLKESTAVLLTEAMESVVTSGTGTACQLDDDMPVAGKTGTTSSEYDLWFCGYTPYLTASIWTGYDENKSLSGDQAFHERMWSKIVSKIDKVKKYKKTNFKQGKNVKAYDICDSSGKVAIDGVCPETHVEYYKKGSEPAKCNYHSNSYTKSYSNSNNYYTKKKYYSSTTTNASENQTTAKSGSKTTAKAKINPDSKGSTKENNNKPTVKAKADTKSKTSGNSSKKNTSEE
ncbi:transglycosylase domain-containing protein [uncultured Eubacterium sp.]|uniref:transglycosylase domain-containing protein n=1 Tax=uncultured Eubacterium sp. TaxID=165185 RepID=UPI00265D26E5|nr:transglycosylase domain-containing protein [uncultured Eubacterium sp.]